MQQIVDSGQLAGAATLVWKNGAARTTCFGWRDIERKLPVERDTIFRIASMTKADYFCRGAHVGGGGPYCA